MKSPRIAQAGNRVIGYLLSIQFVCSYLCSLVDSIVLAFWRMKPNVPNKKAVSIRETAFCLRFFQEFNGKCFMFGE